MLTLRVKNKEWYSIDIQAKVISSNAAGLSWSRSVYPGELMRRAAGSGGHHADEKEYGMKCSQVL